MTDGDRILTIPRHNPVNAFTMGGIVKDAGLSVEEFRKLLQSLTPPPKPASSLSHQPNRNTEPACRVPTAESCICA